ncbi:MAG: CPBP family glutamic-type intramembrane protease [Dehalococcoidia bacterium]
MARPLPDHYETLGVPPGASAGEIDDAYRRLASASAPGVAAGESLQDVRAAYNVLSNSQLRALYDMRREALLGTPAAPPRPPAGSVGVTGKPWGIPAILVVLAIPVLLWSSGLIYTIIEGQPDDLTNSEVIINLIFSILVLDGIFVVGPIAFCFWRYRRGWGDLGLRPFDGSYWWVPPVAAATAYVGTIAYNAVLYALGARPEQDTTQLFDSATVLPLTFFAIVIVAPLAEEIFFRGFVFAGLLRPFGVAGALVASGLLFAMFHVQDGGSALLVPAFAAIGAGFAWIYYKTGSLWPSIATHFLFNLTSFLLLALSTALGNN